MSFSPKSILVRTPNWVGDAVMSTPALRALRRLYPDARITLLARSYVAQVYGGGPWFDEIIFYERDAEQAGLGGFLRLASALRQKRFDLAVILPNSFSSALLTWLAGIPRRLGYRRDGRGWLLTDGLEPIRSRGRIVPRNMVDYYLELCYCLGARDYDRHVELYVTEAGEAAAQKILADTDPARPLVGLNPGGAFGSSKLWLPDRFAQVSDLLVERYRAQPILFSAPREAAIAERVIAAARHPILWSRGRDLNTLKSLLHRCALLVTNDTGARHVAVAFGKPVVVIMGSTSSLYTDVNLERTILVRKRVDCGPCQDKRCRLDHRCMTAIPVDDVANAAAKLMEE